MMSNATIKALIQNHAGNLKQELLHVFPHVRVGGRVRAHHVWRNVTGNDPDAKQMEQTMLPAKIQTGLLLPVRSKLAEVFGLGNMTKSVYTDYVAHQVELQRKKEHDQKVQDQKTYSNTTGQ